MGDDEIRELFEEYDRKAEFRYRAILTEIQNALATLRILRLEDHAGRNREAGEKSGAESEPSLDQRDR